jgi:ferric-dicitrate binding protein FerR (iron transport regulator)
MKPQEFKELLERYAHGECTPQEEKFIDDWYERIGDQDKEEVEIVLADHNDEKKREHRLWASINPEIPHHRKNFFRSFRKMAAAILLLAVSALGIYLLSGEATLQEKFFALKQGEILTDESFRLITNTGTTPMNVNLDDGSVVILQPFSEIRFIKKFGASYREVYFSGEAFFKVKRDEHRPFIVYSNEVVTRVLGTSFNIKAYANEKEITVAVKTGKVSVYKTKDKGVTSKSPSDEQAVILTPNQQIVYNRVQDRVVKQLVEKPEIVLQKPTLFTMNYDGVPVTRILKVIEENYGVIIDYKEEELSGCVLTTSMSDEGLYERIDVICRAINAEYNIENAVIYIKGRGCN